MTSAGGFIHGLAQRIVWEERGDARRYARLPWPNGDGATYCLYQNLDGSWKAVLRSPSGSNVIEVSNTKAQCIKSVENHYEVAIRGVMQSAIEDALPTEDEIAELIDKGQQNDGQLKITLTLDFGR